MAKSQAKKIVVSERALFARISRAVRKDEMLLRRCRKDNRDYHYLGDYYTVLLSSSGLAYRNLDLEDYGREVGALKPYECLEKE